MPTYNAEKYIKRCLESCINQTLSEIEIICVDKNSKDKTLEFLMNYKIKDDRIKVISLNKDSSALVARKRAVEAANGEYILFIDAVDYLDLEACNLLYEKIKSSNVEILHFSAKVFAVDGNMILPDEINLKQKLIEPYKVYLKNEEVFNKFFIEEKSFSDLHNKLFSAKLCKEVFSRIENEYMQKAEELYTYFVIAYFAKSYYGWKSKKKLYYYNIENNYNNKINAGIDIFKQYCYQYKVINAIEDFAKKEKIFDKVKENIYEYKKKFIKESINIWLSFNKDDYSEATNILFESWGIETILSILANEFEDKKGYIAKKFYNADLFPIKDKEIKVIGIYYNRMNIGGIQRVISLIIPRLVKLGYKVVLITDEESSSNDYIIDCEYTREIISSKTHIDRLKCMKKIVDKHSIDCMFYHSWYSPFLLWDMIYLQYQNIPVVVHTHLIFTYTLELKNCKNLGQVYTIALANGIVVLSDADKYFWSLFNKNTKFIHNPIDLTLKDVERSKGDEKIVIWAARISPEKQLDEALNVLQVAIKYDPDIKMWVLGDNAKKSVLKQYKKKAKKMKIDKNIIFWGYQKDVYKFYERASVNLVTSTIEGYGMSMLEAKAHGIPTVMYNMDYLYFASEEKGTISVSQGDYTKAAKEVVYLVNNKERWNKLSDISYRTFNEIANIDYAKELMSIIDNIKDTKIKENPEDKKVVEILTDHCITETHIKGIKDVKRKLKTILKKFSKDSIKNIVKKILKK